MTDRPGPSPRLRARDRIAEPSADMAHLLAGGSSLPVEEPPTPATRPSRVRRVLHLGVIVAPLVGAYFFFWDLELYVLALIAAWIPAHILSELRS